MTKQDFLAQIEKDCIAEDMPVLLKREKLPLILWGCGDVADAVYRYLSLHQIEIAGVWVDGDTESRTFHGIEIESRKAILKKFPEFNIILGHSKYDKGAFLKKEIAQIKQIYYAFSIHYEQYEKVPYDAIEREAERFVSLLGRVADEASVKNLIAYLNTKMTGNVRYILDAHQENMSFYHNDIFQMTDQETFMDIGAYNGDTIRLFLDETKGQYRKIIALEPDDKSFLELNEYLSQTRLKNVVTSKAGAWKKEEELQFKTGNEQISGIDMGDSILKTSNVITIHAVRLDELFEEEDISFIKINYYEGVLEAIEGCRGILLRTHPKLAIDIGFDIYNVLSLSEFIDSLKQGYRIYLRFNRAMSSTFTLYAV